MALCQYVKKEGGRCQAKALVGSTFCFFHDPAKADERAKARSEGGSRGKDVVLPTDTPDRRLESAADVADLLAETINQVRRGQVDPRTSNAVGYLAGILLKAYEVGKLEDRLAALESAVSGNRPEESRGSLLNLTLDDDATEEQDIA